ncbi:Tenascin-N [Liparis tanakae]|uniref:Tenascin-N n=1 Tax=Liparis tanakae TaxID=230148 RepID=A0A4Z2FWQ0_9TELE|nr:Tenascin-N [Liparis tanakae]
MTMKLPFPRPNIDAPAKLITTEVTEDTATVSWDLVQADIGGYMLSYTSAGGSSAEIPVGRDRTSYRLLGLRPGALHTVYIWAFKDDYVSRKASTVAETELDAPTNVLARDETESSFRVSWDHTQAEIDGYLLAYSSPEGSSEEIPVRSDSTSYMLTGLRPGVLHTVYIWAVKGSKASRKSSTQAETELDAPANLSARDETESSFSVSWAPAQAAVDGYILTYNSSDGASGEIPVGPDSTSYRLTGLRPGAFYNVYIWAIKGNKASRQTSTQAQTELDAPANLSARDETESSFRVSWDPVQAEIDGYVLSYSPSEGASGEIPVRSDSTSYMLAGLRPGVLHTVNIWAFQGSKASRKISTNAETDIDPPKELKATDVTLESALLTWVPPLADIEGYVLIYRDEDGNMEAVERQLDAGQRRFAVSSLETGKRYIVSITAYRGGKRSEGVETTFRTVGLLYPFPMDCVQIMKNGNQESGVYTVYVHGDRSKPIEAYCDMETDGGGWLVLQRRTSGKLDFMKRWRQYIAGFGNMTDEFWIGLDKIYELTNTPTQCELRFDLGVGAERAYAVYDDFKIAPVKQKFKITIGNYSGTAGDAMTYHQGRPWTTVDNDNDIALGNCALVHRGAWWREVGNVVTGECLFRGLECELVMERQKYAPEGGEETLKLTSKRKRRTRKDPDSSRDAAAKRCVEGHSIERRGGRAESDPGSVVSPRETGSYTMARASPSGVIVPVFTEIHKSSAEFPLLFFVSDLAVAPLQRRQQMAWRQQQQWQHTASVARSTSRGSVRRTARQAVLYAPCSCLAVAKLQSWAKKSRMLSDTPSMAAPLRRMCPALFNFVEMRFNSAAPAGQKTGREK